MGIVDMLLIGVGLSMDAFAVSVCKGLQSRTISWAKAFITALFFGAFQAFMPLIGWLLGTSIRSVIEPVDHWIAFVLLAIVGGKMLYDGIKDTGERKPDNAKWSTFFAELVILAIATSIDALVVGISFAMTDMNIIAALVVIGVTTFILSLVGTVIGNKFGSKFERPATILGGVALILLGLKILLEHLFG